jgi:hypothetical protein
MNHHGHLFFPSFRGGSSRFVLVGITIRCEMGYSWRREDGQNLGVESGESWPLAWLGVVHEGWRIGFERWESSSQSSSILVLPVSLIRNEMEGEAKKMGKGRSTR